MTETNLNRLIEKFSKFGKTSGGGITRLTLSQADIEARNYLMKLMKKINLKVTIDDLGNIYGYRAGAKKLPPIIIGSHGDSVENGGNYDGILGVLSAYEVLRKLEMAKIQTSHPIIMINFTNEEGVRFEPAMFTSGVLAGVYDEATIFSTKDKENVIFSDALIQSGFAGAIENRLTSGAAYLEYHIEQGPILEDESYNIGVVEGIIGMVCYEIKVIGESSHAGTTPMKNRKDPLFTAAALIQAFEEKLSSISESLVYTIGSFKVSPGLHTVIPDEVIFTLDMRHRDAAIIEQAKAAVLSIIDYYSNDKILIENKAVWERATVGFAKEVTEVVAASASKMNYSYKKMYSGAGHDAQFLANMMPTAMIFAPSVSGKSHCEDEFTTALDCNRGFDVLYQTVLALDEKLN